MIYRKLVLIFISFFILFSCSFISVWANPQEYILINAAKRAELLKNYKKAEDLYLKFLMKFPASRLIPEVHFRLSNLWLRQGNYNRAFIHLNLLINQYENSVFAIDAARVLVKELMKLEKYKDALRPVKFLISKRPYTQIYIVQYAKILYKLGKKEDAIKVLENCIKNNLGKNFTYIEQEYISFLSEDGRLKRKKQEILEFIKRNKSVSTGDFYLGALVAEALSDKKVALTMYKELLKRGVTNRNILIKMCKNFIYFNEIDLAISHLEKLFNKNQRDQEVLKELVGCYKKIGNISKIKNVIKRYIEKDRAGGYYVASNILSDLKLYDLAVKMLLEARKQRGDPYFYYEKLASIYILWGKYDKALGEYMAFLKKHPRSYKIIYIRIRDMFRNADHSMKKAIIKFLQKSISSPKLLQPIYKMISDLYLDNEELKKAAFKMRELSFLKNDRGRGYFQFLEHLRNSYKFQRNPELIELYEDFIKVFTTFHLRFRAHVSLAALYRQNRKFKRAVEVLKYLLTRPVLMSDAAKLNFAIGEILLNNLNNYKEAFKYLKRALKNAPEISFRFETLLLLAKAWALINEFNEENEYLEMVFASSFKKIKEKALVFKAECALYRGEVKKAMKILKGFLKDTMTKSDETNDVIKILALIENGKKDKANFELYCKGYGYFKMRKFNKSKEIMNRLVESSSTLRGLALEVLANILRQKEPEQAIKVLKQGIKKCDPMSPQTGRLILLLGEIYENDLKLNREAVIQYRRFLKNFSFFTNAPLIRKKIRNLKLIKQKSRSN